MSKPVVLITGANRGIGLGYVTSFLDQGYRVIAAARDPSSISIKLSPEHEGDLIPIKIDALDSEGPRKAIEELKAKGVERIDIVIANAGVYPPQGKFIDLTAESAEEVWRVNVLSPLMLYQAAVPLMPKGGKFVVVGSRAGVLGMPKTVDAGAYGQSKAAVHFLIRRLHYENEDLISFAILPGHVVTDMGQASAQRMGMQDAPRRLEDTLPGMMKVILGATREQQSGNLCEWDGTFSDW